MKNHSYERVFIIGPSHQGGTKDVYLSSFDKYKTPLGNIDVDKQITEELSKNLLFGKNEQIEFDEHSIEVQLPFLQKTLNTFKIIPILFANQTLENAKKLFKSIYKYIDKKTLVVISTDLSHYYSSNIAKEKDKLLIDKLICSDSIGLQKLIADGTSEACGIGGLYFAIEFAKKLDLPITPLKYSHSGFINKDFSQVVGYFAGIMGKRYAE
ncbi:MAG: AmmeMemoRadiSam system protein B [Candidatus Cloacimonadota bacterium]|nr:AmmeMemoRadiSam system protein B [Candidatus Cloacimonadota bacterium]